MKKIFPMFVISPNTYRRSFCPTNNFRWNTSHYNRQFVSISIRFTLAFFNWYWHRQTRCTFQCYRNTSKELFLFSKDIVQHFFDQTRKSSCDQFNFHIQEHQFIRWNVNREKREQTTTFGLVLTIWFISALRNSAATTHSVNNPPRIAPETSSW